MGNERSNTKRRIKRKPYMTNCKGCHTKNACNVRKAVIYINYIENNNLECPCTICLVKAICVKICDEYRQFSTKFHHFKYGMDIR